MRAVSSYMISVVFGLGSTLRQLNILSKGRAQDIY